MLMCWECTRIRHTSQFMFHRGRERRYLKQEEVGFTRRRELNKMATVAQVTMTTIA